MRVGSIDSRRKENLVDVAPTPVLTQLKRFDDRMAS